MPYFKIGSVVEIEESLAKAFKIDDNVGILYNYIPTNRFPYKVRVRGMIDSSIPCEEKEIELTNKPIPKDLLEWKRKNIVNGKYIGE